MIALVVIGVAVISFSLGRVWQLHQSPGAIRVGDRIDIRHGNQIVGSMLLTSHTTEFNGQGTATLESTEAYLTRRRIPS